MEIRITFRCESYLEGDSMKEIRDKFETSELWKPENPIDYVELCSVEDAETHKDLIEEWDHCYNSEE